MSLLDGKVALVTGGGRGVGAGIARVLAERGVTRSSHLTGSCSRYPCSVERTEALDELMVSLQRLGRLFASRRVASRIATVAGVDVSQQGVTLLRALLRDGAQPVAALAASAAMDLGAVSRQVRLLEEVGAVRRSGLPGDGRVALLELTPEGRHMAERIHAVGARHLEDALHGWSDADERALARLMQRLVYDMASTPVQAGGAVADRAPGAIVD